MRALILIAVVVALWSPTGPGGVESLRVAQRETGYPATVPQALDCGLRLHAIGQISESELAAILAVDPTLEGRPWQ